MARPLPIGSPQKLSFFRLALDHYHKAENYMFVVQCEYTTASVEFMNRTSHKPHRQFSSSSSDSSQLSSRSSTFSAPDIGRAHGSQFSILSAASSLCSDCSKPEDELYNPLKPPPLRIKKKVSFSSSLPKNTPSCTIDTDTRSMPSAAFYSGLDSSSPKDAATSETESSFLLSSSITRYNIHLASLRTQLTRRLFAIGELIQAIQSTHCSSSKPKPT
jgi:hypothetical protein